VRGLNQGLSEEERYAVADQTVVLLKERVRSVALGRRGEASASVIDVESLRAKGQPRPHDTSPEALPSEAPVPRPGLVLSQTFANSTGSRCSRLIVV